MNEHLFTAGIDAQRQAWETAAEILEKSDRGLEQFVRMLTVDVGHTDSEVVYTENKLELRRYDPGDVEHETPIFITYALVNRPYILDLQPDKSVIKRFLEAGFEVYLIRWGEPSILDRTLTLWDYVCRYMDNCIDAALAHSDVEDLHLLGYCMGGSMAIMYTALDDAKVRTLSLMASPLSFNGQGGILERWAGLYDPDIVVDTLGNLPAELLAIEFSMMDPIEQYLGKYVKLSENLENDAFIENFARMEQWIWDGVDVAGETYREFVNDIYRDNKLANDEFVLGDERIVLGDIEVPVLQIVGEYDHLVPPASSKPLHEKITSTDDRLIEFPAGHIGISVSSSAHDDLWPDVVDWFVARSHRERNPVRPQHSSAASDTVATVGTGPSDRSEPAVASEHSEHSEYSDHSERSEHSEPSEYSKPSGPAESETSVAEDDLPPAPEPDEAPNPTTAVEPAAGDSDSAAAVPAKKAVAAVADRTAEVTAEEGAAPSSKGDGIAGNAPVESVDGIGSTYADRLAAAGIETRADLGERDAETLARVAETSVSRVADWLCQVS